MAGPTRLVTLKVEPKFRADIKKFEGKLLGLKEKLFTVKQQTWDAVNLILEKRVLDNFEAHRAQHTQKDSTTQRKKRAVKAGFPQPVSNSVFATPKAEFIYEYGRRTGFWVDLFKQPHPVGAPGTFVRQLASSSSGGLSGGMFLWGINLATLYHGYPAFILKPGKKENVLSRHGAPDALISVSDADLNMVKASFITQHVIPALALARFRSGAGRRA